MPEEAVIDAPANAAPSTQATITDADSDDAPPGAHMANLNKFMSDTLTGVPASEPAKADDTRPVKQPELKTVDPKAKPGTEKAPDAKETVAEPEKEPATFTSPSAANFKKIVAERDDWKKKATDHETAVKTHSERAAKLEQEYTEYKTKTAIDPKEIEAVKKRSEELEAQLQRHALSETPKFKAHFDSKLEAAVERAVNATGKDKAETVKIFIEAPDGPARDRALDDLLAGLESEGAKMRLTGAFDAYSDARKERTKELDRHKENLRELRAVEQKQAQEKKERDVTNRKAMLAETLKQAEKFDAFKTNDDPEHNLTVAKSRKLVEDFVMGGDVPDSVVLMLPVLASEGERLQKVVPTLNAKITELEEALKKYQGAAPQLEGQGAPKDEANETKSYLEQVEANWPGTLKPSR